MKNRIIAAAFAVIMAASLYACDAKTNRPATDTDAGSTSKFETASMATTAVSATTVVTSTVPSTVCATTKNTVITTKATTEKVVKTTRKLAATTKKVMTTIAEVLSTTAEKTTTQPRTKVNSLLEKRTEEETVITEMKYGVVNRKIITKYYQELEDGTEVLVNEEITTDVVDKTKYEASYSDLLPAAKENRELYRSEINEVLNIVNAYRAEGGLEPLILNEELTVIACARAEEIAWSGNHNHIRPNFKSCFSLMTENGFSKGTAGENLGWGFNEPQEVCEAWKASETHYENIMKDDFTQTGIGVAKDPKNGKLCWSQYFYCE